MALNSTPLVQLDLTKAPDQLIIDLINKDNGTDLKIGELTFGVPVLNSTNSKHNSKVKATASDKAYYSGSVSIHYNRIDIAKVIGDKSTRFVITDERMISDIIAAIDARYSTRLTPNDYVDGPLPSFDPANTSDIRDIELVANPLSLVYINKITLSLDRGVINLSTVLVNLILQGLTYTPNDDIYLSL